MTPSLLNALPLTPMLCLLSNRPIGSLDHHPTAGIVVVRTKHINMASVITIERIIVQDTIHRPTNAKLLSTGRHIELVVLDIEDLMARLIESNYAIRKRLMPSFYADMCAKADAATISLQEIGQAYGEYMTTLMEWPE